MIISAINGTVSIQKNKYINKNEQNLKKSDISSDKSNSIKMLSNAHYRPNFGFEPLLIYALIYAGIVGGAYYQSSVQDKKRKEEEEQLKEEARKRIEQISNECNVSYKDAEKYQYNFMRIAEIPMKNDGNEIGMNAVMGYGIEKYKLAMDVITPILAKQKDTFMMGTNSNIPNGILFYGPPGGGKTYIAEKMCEHLEYFGTNITNLMLTETDHEKNAQLIKDAFEYGKNYYKETGKYTVINFNQDIDNIFLNRNIDIENVKEIQAMLSCAENCEAEGVIWVGTANNPKLIDPAILRAGRTDLKMPIGNMEKFAVADVLKYNMYKVGEKDSTKYFNYEKVVDYMEKNSVVFTPAELELIVKSAQNHKLNPEENLTPDMLIAEMDSYSQNDFPTLTPKLQEKFKQDQEYLRTIGTEITDDEED